MTYTNQWLILADSYTARQMYIHWLDKFVSGLLFQREWWVHAAIYPLILADSYTASQPAGVFTGWINLFQVYCFNGNGGYMQLFTQWP